jgi:shikimate kinase
MPPRHIYLIGFSGTGKSTVAGLIAAQLGLVAHDIDQLIVTQSGMAIAAIFADEGEAGFRERESAALLTVAAEPPAVVATGGGAVLRDENRALMAASGWVIALEARPETIRRRIEAQLQQQVPDAVRPLLSAADPLAQARVLKQQRQPLYALADWTIHTDRLSPPQVVAEVVRAVALLAMLEDENHNSA